MADNFIFFYVHLNKHLKHRYCLETFLNYKHDNEAQKAYLNTHKGI